MRHFFWIADNSALTTTKWNIDNRALPSHPKSKGFNLIKRNIGVIPYTTQKAVEHLGMKLDGATIVVQGFGNAGSVAAMHFENAGAKVIAVNNSKGGIFND